jgi:hypothetical protein
MRRFSRLFDVSRTTVKRKVEFLASQARLNQKKWLDSLELPYNNVQFDDLETFEHTKCKPVTVTLFVESKNLKILGYSVAKIGAKGHLAKLSRAKYGIRENNIREKREVLFNEMKPYIAKNAVIGSDRHPHYSKSLKRHFPDCNHKNFKGVRGCITGQGELKKVGYDPLFAINQTFAMLRDNLKRLSRRTWCTTKKIEALDDQIAIYIDFHNQFLKTKSKNLKKTRNKASRAGFYNNN